MGNRRDFLSKACVACGGILLSGAAVAALESCSTTKSAGAASTSSSGELIVIDGKLKIPLSQLGNQTAQIITAKGAPKDLYITKSTDGTYKVLLLKCPHMGGSVVPKDNAFVCNLHGSTFDANGNLTKGPSKVGLTAYKAEVSGSDLIVQING